MFITNVLYLVFEKAYPRIINFDTWLTYKKSTHTNFLLGVSIHRDRL